jgi:glucokinase
MVLDPRDEHCNTWNALVSQKALFNRIKALTKAGEPSLLGSETGKNTEPLTIKRIIAAAKKGDKVALCALAETGSWLGTGIADLINLLNPQYVVIGGPLSMAYEFFLLPIQAEIAKYASPWMRNSCQIITGENNEDAGVIGAVSVVLWNIFNKLQKKPLPSLNS